MTAVAAWHEGWRRALGVPWIVAGIWASTLALALPLAWVLRGTIAAHLGSSLAAERAAAGVNYDWWNEFLAQASGIGLTFVPSILGFAAVLRNVSDVADGARIADALVPVALAHLLLSVFLLGGVLDRLARDRPIGAAAFFAACGVYVFRFLRLGLAAGLAYWVLWTTVHRLLLGRGYVWLTHDLTSERTAFVYRMLLYAVFGALVILVNVVFDYAKVRLVVEDRRSAWGALAAAVRFVGRQPGAVAGLYALNALAFVTVAGLYALVAPGVTSAGTVWVALLAGQLYIVLRIVVRLMFAASAIALFQGRLAHARYTARAMPRWPDSPAAEVVRPE